MGWPDDRLVAPEMLVENDTYLEVIDRCTYLADDPDFMLCSGIELPIQSLGLKGQAMLSADTLWDALSTAQGSVRYFQSGSHYDMSFGRGRCRVRYIHDFGDNEAAAQEVQYTIGMFANLLSQARHKIDPDIVICYPGAKSSHLKWLPAATKAIDGTVGFIDFKLRALLSPMPLRNSSRSEILKRFIETNPIDRAIEMSVTNTVTELARASMGITRPSQPKIAAMMGMNVRALQRSLQIEQTTFRQILKHSRQAVALDDLQAGKSVTETAMKLGYDHPQNFATAFRKWHGHAPSSI